VNRHLADLKNALDAREEIAARTAGKRVVVFLDYDGTLTPIVERPELAVLSDSMREKVRALADRLTLAIVSGRDRPDVEKLVGLDNLVFAGSHGFDIKVPGGRAIAHEMGGEYGPLLDEVKARLHRDVDPIPGSLIEPKRSSVAVHYRLVDEKDVGRIKAVVDDILARHPELRVTPGKKVWEIQPKIDWNKGKAVLWLLKALDVDGDDIVPFYLGDDVTDEDAFRALSGRGIGVYVGRPGDAEAQRETAADYVLDDVEQVGLFLDGMGR